MKIHVVGAELFHSKGRKDRREEFDSHFSQFCKWPNITPYRIKRLHCMYLLADSFRLRSEM